MSVTRLTLVLTDICAGVSPVLSDVCEQPMDFAIIAWPKARPDRPTVIATTPSRRDVNAAMGCAIDINKKADAAAGKHNH